MEKLKETIKVLTSQSACSQEPTHITRVLLKPLASGRLFNEAEAPDSHLHHQPPQGVLGGASKKTLRHGYQAQSSASLLPWNTATSSRHPVTTGKGPWRWVRWSRSQRCITLDDNKTSKVPGKVLARNKKSMPYSVNREDIISLCQGSPGHIGGQYTSVTDMV